MPSHCRIEGLLRSRRLSAVITAAIVLIASLPATRTWSQHRHGTEQRLLFEPSALEAAPGVFDRGVGSPPSGRAKSLDEKAPKDLGTNSFGPLRSNGKLVLPDSARAAPGFGRTTTDGASPDKQPRIVGPKVDKFSLGLETESRFRPDELPNGDKTHALTYQRDLYSKFFGLSLTSPID